MCSRGSVTLQTPSSCSSNMFWIWAAAPHSSDRRKVHRCVRNLNLARPWRRREGVFVISHRRRMPCPDNDIWCVSAKRNFLNVCCNSLQFTRVSCFSSHASGERKYVKWMTNRIWLERLGRVAVGRGTTVLMCSTFLSVCSMVTMFPSCVFANQKGNYLYLVKTFQRPFSERISIIGAVQLHLLHQQICLTL